MKINRAEFPIDEQPVWATESRIVYDEPMPELELLWNRLADYYGNKMKEATEYAAKEAEFYYALAQCRVASETALTTLNLIQQDVLRLYLTEEGGVRDAAYIKPFIIEEIRRILAKKRAELVENIEDEKNVYAEVGKLQQYVHVENGVILIHFGLDHKIEYGKMPSIDLLRPIRLACTISYGDLRLVWCEEKVCESVYDKLNAYYEMLHLTQLLKRGQLVVEVGEGKEDGNNPLCKAVLDDLRKGIPLVEMYPKIIALLPRYLLTRLLEGQTNIQILETDTPRCADSRSATFFVVTDEHVYKVERVDDAFMIYRNGMPMRFAAPGSS